MSEKFSRGTINNIQTNRTPTLGITKFTILVEAFLLYITMHLVSLRHVRL